MKDFLELSQNFILLIAPVAWGKTHLLLKLLSQGGQWIYLSPLRALAEEFNLKIQNIIPTYTLNNSQKDWCLVLTPEKFLSQSFTFTQPPLVIMDEFHLFEEWGSSFRPRMLEAFWNLVSQGCSILGLTATCSQLLRQRVKEEVCLNFQNVLLIDQGNYQWKYCPQKIIHLPDQSIFWRRFSFEIQKKQGCTLLFCAYREEVNKLFQLYQKSFKTLSCVGGESEKFIQKLQAHPNPELIIATSCLSHGVNLPQVSQVFISYPETNHDLWLQMVGRGGRQGHSYQAFVRNLLDPAKKTHFLNKVLVHAQDQWLQWFHDTT